MNSKTKGLFGIGLWIWAILLYAILAIWNITSSGVVRAIYDLVMVGLLGVILSVVIAALTPQKEKLLSYTAMIFIIVVLYKIIDKLVTAIILSRIGF